MNDTDTAESTDEEAVDEWAEQVDERNDGGGCPEMFEELFELRDGDEES